MKIVLLESLGISNDLLVKYVDKLKEKGHEFEFYERDLDVDKQIMRLHGADVLMIANMPLDERIIAECESLKFINIAFTGVDHVPTASAKEKNIAVSNASGYSNDSVAELVLGLTLSLLRKLPQVDVLTRNGGVVGDLVGNELKGKTVGIIGTGAIGSRTAELFNAFGCKVLGYDTQNVDLIGVDHVELDELYEHSDIISLHCPLIESTRGLINEEAINRMKDGVVFINAARGPIVDSDALAKALISGKVGAAGIDVYEIEPPLATDHPLLHTPNTIVAPHIAYLSRESMEKRAKIVFDSLDSWIAGNQVNKIV